ncbi:Protein-disulfide isomerase [Rhizobiales bacterium GAS113]|nr:Protein-disulfide isomerase [Rhizobiales bacterium GAS113]
MTPDRRLLLSALAGALILPLSRGAKADDAFQFPLKDDSGAPIANYRLPSQLTTDDLTGVIWAGSATPDVTLVEFFDYNCPYCRKAVKDLDALLARDRELRLGLVNNSILAPGSAQAAKVQLAVMKLKGAPFAYRYHLRLLGKHGPVDGAVALQLAAEMGLDRAEVEHVGDTDEVESVLRRQVALASSLGFVATPSFMIDGVGILGYPGAKSMGRIVGAVRKCDKVVCG